MQADNQGRVLLPVKLRQYVLGDARDVEISGALDHIRIVASAVAQEKTATTRSTATRFSTRSAT